MSTPASILVCRLSALGDVVLALPVVDALRSAYPDAHLAFLSRMPHGRVLSGVKSLSALHLWRGPRHELPPAVRDRTWDLIVDLSATGRSRNLLAALDARRVLRARKQPFRRFAFVKLRPLGGGAIPIASAVDRMFSAVTPLGLDRAGHRPRFDVEAPPENGPVLIAPGGGRDAKRWPVDRFAEVARRLTEGAQPVLILGSDVERELLERVARDARSDLAEVCCGPDPARLPAVVSRCRVALTNDSGILHVAEAVGVRVVAIFGPTHPRLGFAPLAAGSRAMHSGIRCSPCDVHGPDRCPKGHHRCMGDVRVEDVLAELDARRSPERTTCA